MPGAFLEIERLINRSVQIEHEVDAQVAVILENVETLAARAADVEVQNELVHPALEEWQIPAAAPDALKLVGGQARAAEPVAIRRGEGFDLFVRRLPIGLSKRGEAPLDAVGVVAAGVRPEHHGRAGVKIPAADDNFIALSRASVPGRWEVAQPVNNNPAASAPTPGARTNTGICMAEF